MESVDADADSQRPRGASDEIGAETGAAASPPLRAHASLAVAARQRFSSGDEDDDDEEESASVKSASGSCGDASGRDDKAAAASGKKKRSPPVKKAPPATAAAAALPTLDSWLATHGNAQDVEPPVRLSRGSSASNTPVDTPATTPSPRKRKRKPQQQGASTPSVPAVVSIDDLEVSVDALREAASQRGLDGSSLSAWQCNSEGRLVDPEQHTFKSVRDAVRALAFNETGRVPREDMYFLAILRRKLAEMALPFNDGPITVLALGRTVPISLFFSQKKLFPVGYEAIATVQLAKVGDAKIRLNCKIVEGNNQKSPIFVVSPVRDPDVIFRSYVGSKAWKKAIGHFESMGEDELALFVEDFEIDGSECLLSTAGEDGFGLLRRNITRILEGGHLVLQCNDYQFWEERHPVSSEAHTKLRSRLLKQLKESLRRDDVPKEEVRVLTSQELLVAEFEKSPEQLYKEQQRRERERREAEKQSVRDAARKLLEIEMKAQEDAKEAQRKEREDRKNALLEAKMELVRQKEARRDASRREKEEERRMREEERDMRKFLKEEEKRRKVEEKEMQMQQKIDELRERRRLREQQRSIIENGVNTAGVCGTNSDARPGEGIDFSLQKQRTALLKFVREERERRRRRRLWERRRMSEFAVWRHVKTTFQLHQGSLYTMLDDHPQSLVRDGRSFPLDAFTRVVSFDQLPTELHNDVLFIWDAISTFSDILRMPVVPPLDAFVELFAKRLVSSSSAISIRSIESIADSSLASIHSSIVRVLLEEYFPSMQMGTSIDEFLRTRPLNLHTWPEVARQVCLLALESTHPSIDDQVVKALKGSRSNRDDPVLFPLRQRLHDRGSKLLVGEKYEEFESKENASELASDTKINRESIAQASVSPKTHHGIVVEDAITSLFRADWKDGHIIVGEVLFQKLEGQSDSDQPANFERDTEREKINVGAYIIALNGQPLTGLPDIGAFHAIVATTPLPHGLLLSSVPPPAKPPMKHIPTTQTANKLKRCAHVLKILRSKELAGPFDQPVDTELYPDYLTAVPEPMDLGTIQEKLEDEEYENDDDVESFIDDVNLVWKNCYTFNSMKAEISQMAKKLSAIFDRLMEEWVESDVVRPLISVEEDHCRMCRTNQVRDRLLLCDRCDASYHTFCLTPPLKKVPTGEWYCPRCVEDPTFSPDVVKKKLSEGEKDSAQVIEVVEYTQLEKNLLQALEFLSREDFSQLTLPEFVTVSRVLTELMLETSAIQDLYRSLEDRANELRKECGDSLADLLRSWDHFAPPKASSGIDLTKRFIIDGIEHELSDELLTYLEAKTIAEQDDSPIPEFLQHNSSTPTVENVEESDDDSSSDDEIQLLEELGDAHLAASVENALEAESHLSPSCEFCGLEDGVVNGALKLYKQSPVTHSITELDNFTVPPVLSSVRKGDDDAASLGTLLCVQDVQPQDLAAVGLLQTGDGVQYVAPVETGNTKEESSVIYSINDCLVDGMSCDEITQAIRVSKHPVCIYSTTSAAHDALQASVSIVSFSHPGGIDLGVELVTAHNGFIFVRTLKNHAYAELSDQVFPGDVLWMVNSQATFGKPVEAVQKALQSTTESSNTTLVLVRAPSATIKRLAKLKSSNTSVLAARRTKLNDLLTQVVTIPSQRIRREYYEVKFEQGPLGLALSLDGRVIVKSLNDNSDGTPGQASLSGRIQAGDVIERVNGNDYGMLRDLSQFTASLTTLPRPIVIKFSREVPSHIDQSGADGEANDEYNDKASLRKRLGIVGGPFSSVKTVYVARGQLSSLPLLMDDFGINRPTIVHIDGIIRCVAPDTVNEMLSVGDQLVGANGCSTAELSWHAVARVLSQVHGPLHLHFAERVRFRSIFRAHDACIHQANIAWSDADHLRPKIEKAQRIEAFIKYVVPRTKFLGKCCGSYTYYHFQGDKPRLYAKSSTGQWLVVGSSSVGLRKVLAYLDGSEVAQDHAVASRIRALFPPVHSSEDGVDVILEPYLRAGSFALKTEVELVGDVGEGDKFDASISYFGRKYFLGSFSSRQEADIVVKRAFDNVEEVGVHTSPASSNPANLVQQLPSMQAPALKAEAVIRRSFQRRYEYGGVPCANGQLKVVALSQSVITALRRGMNGDGAQLGYGAAPGSASVGGQHRLAVGASSVSMNQGEYYKRKAPEPLTNDIMRQRLEMQKRARPLSGQPVSSTGTYPSPRLSPPEIAKRQLQPMADQGRAMLAGWNNYARSPTPQTSQGLAYACLTSFEEVKKATTRLMSDSNHPVPDAKTFVCLHHAFVIGLICAMTTQALTNSQRSQGDSLMVKAIADAFATALLSCIDPSSALRSRAIAGFATVVKQCDRAARPRDLSEPLHHVANFIVQFVQVSRYLSVGSFDDLTQCRPVVGADQRAMEMLPASFVQQVRLLENVRRAFIARSGTSNSAAQRLPNVSPGHRMSGNSTLPNAVSSNEQFFHVDFGRGPLGIMINYSTRGKVIVTEYSGDRGQMGQAQASGKVAIGDEVYAINGRLVESIGGMEGFKSFVASGQRPVRVTFKVTAESMVLPGRGGVISQRAPVSSSFSYSASATGGAAQFQHQQIEPIPLAPPAATQSGVFRATGGSQAMPRAMYSHQPLQQGVVPQQGFPPMSFPSTSGANGYDSLPDPFNNNGMGMTNMSVSTAWPQQTQQLPPFNPQPLMPTPLNPRMNGTVLETPPPFHRSSASMGFPSPPDVLAMPSQGPPGSMGTQATYGTGFVAPNDPTLQSNDPNSISYYDAHGTTFRSTPEFEIDTTATSASSVVADETSTVEGDGNDSVLDMDTEEENDDDRGDLNSADLNSGSISQMTTPANSDGESDPEGNRVRERLLIQPSNLAPFQPAIVSSTHQPQSKVKEDPVEVVDADEDMSLSLARRSARVPRKITTNIADMYNPDLNGSARGRGGGGFSGLSGVVEPAHGEVGELATELLEDFRATIRSSKDNVPMTLQLLRAQLLTIEAAIPREAFRAGKWTRAIRAAWAEMVVTCDSSTILVEATLFLESNLENEWLDSCWKSSFLPTARSATSSATIASAAMRLHALDDAISYVRAKRGGGRRKQPQQRSSGSSTQTSPVKAATIDLTAAAASAMHPSELAFVAKLRPGTVDVANTIINRILAMQRDKTHNVVLHRQALRELHGLTDLNENQLDQWIRAATYQAQQLQVSRTQPINVSITDPGSSMRQPTPKRKMNPSPAGNSDQRPSRKRKTAPASQASLPCFQMHESTSAYCIPSPADPTLRPRLDAILSTLLKNELALPFAAPVNVRDVPGYTDIVECPMDLGTIRTRLSRGFYDGRCELVAQHVNLVWTNCFNYNRIDSEISKSANRLRSVFNRLFEHWISDQAPGTPVSSLPSEEACRQCVQSHASDQMLLCDSCDAAYHLFCLSPPLKGIPEGDWYCPRCPIQQLSL